MGLIDFLTGSGKMDGDSNGSVFTRVKDSLGNNIDIGQREKIDTTQKGLLVSGKNDDWATFLRTDRKGNIITGNYTPEIREPFEGATVNVQKWTATSTTFVPAQSTASGYQHNPTNITAINTGTMLVSQRLMYKQQRQPLHIKRRWRHSMVANSVSDFGFGSPAALTTLIVPNGAMFRCTSSGTIQALITYNNSEIGLANVIAQSTLGGNVVDTPLTMASLTSNYYTWDIIVDDDNAVFTIQDTGTGDKLGEVSIPVPATLQKMWASTGLPYYERTYNLSSSPASAPTVITTDIICLSTDLNVQMDASQMAGYLSMSAGRNPFTGAQLENHTNSTAPTSATLSNAAAGYTTLGGKYQFAAVAGAVTDYALFGFQVPAGSRFLCEGITINTRNTGAAVATTATTLEWAIGFNSSAVSLATANIVRKQIGHQSFAIGAAAEAVAPTLDVNFVTPEVVESGRFVHVILTMPVGTATASQIIRGQVTIKGRFF